MAFLQNQDYFLVYLDLLEMNHFHQFKKKIYYITTHSINTISKTVPMFLFFLLLFLSPSLPLPVLATEKIQTSCSIGRRPWYLYSVTVHLLCRVQGSSETKFIKYCGIKTLRIIRFPPAHRGKSPAIVLLLILLPPAGEMNGWSQNQAKESWETVSFSFQNPFLKKKGSSVRILILRSQCVFQHNMQKALLAWHPLNYNHYLFPCFISIMITDVVPLSHYEILKDLQYYSKSQIALSTSFSVV